MIPTQELQRLLNAPGIEELWRELTGRMAGFGFDRLIYGVTRFRTPTSLGDPDDFILLSNHSPEYMEVYIGEGLYAHAPMVQWALDHDGACSWSVLQDAGPSEALSPETRRVLDFNAHHNVTAGYSISFGSVSPRTKGALALAARAGLTQADVDAVWQEDGARIEVLCGIAHLRILTLPYAAPRRALTPRQREVLGWVGDGKTTRDIALLLNVSPATLEKHLRLAREALSVETTAQAVLKASFQNQFFTPGA